MKKPETVEEARHFLELFQKYPNGVEAAKGMNISKATVYRWRALSQKLIAKDKVPFKIVKKEQPKKPKILIWDIESSTLDILVNTYGLKNYISYFDPKDVQRDWTMLSVAWKWLDDAEVICVSNKQSSPLDDEGITRIFHSVLEEAEILVGHNMRRFDVKKFNTRALCYGLAPIYFEPRNIIDTLVIARRYFALTSNKLSFIADKLGVASKDESPDWVKVMQGDPEEMRRNRAYNKQDVIVTEQVYKRLRAWDHMHPDLNAWYKVKDTANNDVILCSKCGGNSLEKTTSVFNKMRNKKKKRWRCLNCLGYTVEQKWIKC